MEFKTVILTLNNPNKNDHIYPTEVVAEAIDQIEGPVFGTCLNPMSPPSLDPCNLSHYVTDIHIDGDNVVGTVHILDTPLGRLLKELCADDTCRGTEGFRITSLGHLSMEGGYTTMASLDIISCDFTPLPA